MTVSLLGHTVAPLYVAGLGWVSREIACERFRPRYNGPPCNRCIRCHVLEDATPEECVFERDGAVANQAAVILFPAERSQWSHFGLNPSRIKSATAFSRQGYTLSRLRAGDYLAVAVDVSQSQAWQDSRFLEAAAAIATRVTLHWGAPSVQDLKLQQVTVR